MSKMSDEVFSNVMHDPVVGLMLAPCSLLHTGRICSKKHLITALESKFVQKKLVKGSFNTT